MGLSDMISSSHLGVQSGDFSGFSSCQTRVTHLSGHIMRSISLDSWLHGLDRFCVLFKGARDDRGVVGICLGLVGVLRE